MPIEKAIFEGNDLQYRQALVNKIAAYKKIGNSLNDIIDKSIISSANRLINSKRLDRLNILVDVLKETKESGRLAKVTSRVPEYLGMANILEYNKKYNVFQVTNFSALAAICNNYSMPRIGFFDWIAANKIKKAEKELTEESAAKKLCDLTVAMHKSQSVVNNPKFAAILAALRDYCKVYDSDFEAAMEREAINNLK